MPFCNTCSVPGGYCTEDPRQCPTYHEFQRIEAMKKTTFYCPECDAVGKCEYLYADGDTFVCRACTASYTKAELAEAYSDELAGLEEDAAYIRNQLLPQLTPERAAV